MDDITAHDLLDPHDRARYARVARLVNEALQAASQASIEPDPPSAGRLPETGALIPLPGRVPWLDVVADLALAAGYLADIPTDLAPQPSVSPAATPEHQCLDAIQAAAGTLDALPGPRAHRDVMVRIALTGALHHAQAAERHR